MGVQVKDILDKLGSNKVIEVDVLVKGVNKKEAKNGSSFLDLVLADVTGAVGAKLWDVTEEGEQFFKDHRYVRVQGKTNDFKGMAQLIVLGVEEIPEGELEVGNLIKSAPESAEVLIRDLEMYLEKIEDKAVKEIVSRLYNKNKEKFRIFPAARGHHHAYIEGLLYHTVSMLRLAEFNQKAYGGLDMDIMYGAIILHDMGKIREYSDPYQPEFTEIGSKIGHIVLMAGEIRAVAGELKKEDSGLKLTKLTDLTHAVLAHHGKREWGSPVEPQTKEAELIHQIDMMDSRMNMDM